MRALVQACLCLLIVSVSVFLLVVSYLLWRNLS